MKCLCHLAHSQFYCALFTDWYYIGEMFVSSGTQSALMFMFTDWYDIGEMFVSSGTQSVLMCFVY